MPSKSVISHTNKTISKLCSNRIVITDLDGNELAQIPAEEVFFLIWDQVDENKGTLPGVYLRKQSYYRGIMSDTDIRNLDISGEEIRELRESLGLSLQKFAEKYNPYLIDHQYDGKHLFLVETGKVPPSNELRMAIRKAFPTKLS